MLPGYALAMTRAAARPRLHLRRALPHAADDVRPRARPPGARSHDRARHRRRPRLLHLRPPTPLSALPHSGTWSGPPGPWPPQRRTASREAHLGTPDLNPESPSDTLTRYSVPPYPDLKSQTPNPRGFDKSWLRLPTSPRTPSRVPTRLPRSSSPPHP
uniref:Orf3 5' of PD-ECGF/TP protein n=1 Tax=Homo sapiens TaxID=9606 RepID=Q16192_HUMAN|nr:orf3 5' of PD-ECGF/TP [Homo sapiens]